MATSFFKDMLNKALAELSSPVDKTKLNAAYEAAHHTICKSQILYHWRKINP